MIADRMRRAAGYSLVELMLVTGVITVVGAIAAPRFMAGIDDARASGAAHYVMTRFHHARMLAISRSANVGIRFVQSGTGYELTMYADRNRNGVRAADIARGIDVPIEPPLRLSSQYPGADFGTLSSLPDPDGGGTVGSDPVHFGASHMASFAADGTSSSGSVYVIAGGAQYVVRVLGDTGRIRMMKFNRATNKWLAPQ